MLKFSLIILFVIISFCSCTFPYRRIIKNEISTKLEFNKGDSDTFFIHSISMLERRCEECVWREEFPLEMTDMYGTKNLENVYQFIGRLAQNGLKVKTTGAVVNDSLFYYSRQQWTKRIWGKNPPPQKLNGNFLILSHNFIGFIDVTPSVIKHGKILTIYEFIQLQNGEVTGYSSYTLKRNSESEFQFIRYKDVKRIFETLLNNKTTIK